MMRTVPRRRFSEYRWVKEHRYWTYIMASRSHTLYIGMTNDLGRRIREHKAHEIEGFSAKYNVDRLVWYEVYDNVRRAIGREKQLKGWVRAKKIKLIEASNPTWSDLSDEWGKPAVLGRTDRRSFDSGGEQHAACAQDDRVDCGE